MTLKVRPESYIFVGDGILSDVREQEEGQKRAEDAEGGRDEERILPSAVACRASWCIIYDNRKDVSTNKGTNLSRGCSDSVILAANRGCRSL